MRFLELVQCGGWRAMAPEDFPEEPVMAPITPMVCKSPEKRRRRNNANNASNPSSSSWRPSLGSISEDVITVKMAGKGGEKTRRSGTRSTAKGWSRRERTRSDYMQYSVPPMVPAFTPTAFLF
ncbi:hypothetical protein J5N97_027205 [Dioscorea zingiberensis]|uniref:Uncharacterized protein n=1 Tax=Dioscorea zingiberensis TaxID=325984 RepID=A0A9D5C3N4_9LILI|nr:hypothetical protein J5N97_027205 [Dioscorea zingiberensis]